MRNHLLKLKDMVSPLDILEVVLFSNDCNADADGHMAACSLHVGEITMAYSNIATN